MKIINHKYSDISALKDFIQTNKIENTNKTFIQIFYCESIDEKVVLKLREELKKELSNVMIMGASSGGNVVNGRVEDGSIILAFSIFEKSYANTYSFKSTSINEIIETFKTKIIKEDTKLLILFANVFTFNANILINELNKELPDVIICGGYAGIHYETEKSLIFSQNSINDQLVVTSINSNFLKVSTDYLLNWQPIGKKMIVTKSDENILYEIDNEKAIDIYNYYLGEDVVKGFPKSGLDFPIVFEGNGTYIARVPLSVGDDGSVEISGNIPQGVAVRFSFANVHYSEKENLALLKQRNHSISEATYIYSCVARKKIFEEYLNDELNLLNKIATTTGFMTYGEFFHNCKNGLNTLLNTSTTYITLSEKEYGKVDYDNLAIIFDEKNKNTITLKVLSHLVDRTSNDLEQRTKELEKTILDLKDTQKKLVEAEKMASLGGLVAGVAHEINTPISIGLTGATHLLSKTEALEKEYTNDNITTEGFEDFIKSSKEMSTMIYRNLDRTASLVKSFKQVAVDQTSEERRDFNLCEYIHETLASINNIVKKTQLTIVVNCKEDINLNSYPGAFSQILTNLILNSINHAYEKEQKGEISIKVKLEKDTLYLIYKDDGKGIPEENLSKIYDPFFTTNRSKGGTGLGLNILYNIITSKLNGTINCKSKKNKGVEFIIKCTKLKFI